MNVNVQNIYAYLFILFAVHWLFTRQLFSDRKVRLYAVYTLCTYWHLSKDCSLIQQLFWKPQQLWTFSENFYKFSFYFCKLKVTRLLLRFTSNHPKFVFKHVQPLWLKPNPHTKKVFILSLNICIELILVVWLKSHEFFFSKFNASTDVLLVKNCVLLNVKILVYHSCKNLKVQCQQIFHLRIILIIHVNF